MGSRTIPASELPKISGLVKDVVNMGLWFLYDIRCESVPNAKYSLATDKGEYLLDSEGDVISPVPRDKAPEYLGRITFSGIPAAPEVNIPSI